MVEPQNIYDDPAFFAAYTEFRASGLGLNEVLEQPGFRLLELREPAPVEQALNDNPLLDLHHRRPPFFILSAEL
jgi:hypothetical protein